MRSSYYEKFADGKVVCIDEEIPFEIPQGWEWCRIREISQSYIGLTYNPGDVSEEGTIVLRSSNIKNGKLILDDIVRVKKDIPSKLWVETNDILICARNGSAKLVGKSAIIPKSKERMTFGAFMAICKTALYEYVFMFLQSDLFFGQLRQVSGTTTINQLTQNNFNGFLIPVPPLEEQKRIANKLTAILPEVERYSKAQDKLDSLNNSLSKKIQQSILQDAIQGRLVAQDPNDEPASILLKRITNEKVRLVKDGKLKVKEAVFSIIYKGEDNKYYEKVGTNIACLDEVDLSEIPGNWAYTRLGSLITLLSGRDLEPSQYNACEMGIPYITGASNINCGIQVNRWTTSPVTVSNAGDLLITCKGTVGTMAFNNIGDIHIARQIMAIRSTSLNRQYLHYYLESQLTSLRKQAHSMIPGISREDILSLIIPLPPIQEQQRIVEKVKSLYEEIS